MASLGLLGALGGASEEFLADRKDQQKRERDMNDYETRAQFAATLQEKLLERKMQLAQQYPTYTHFVTDSVTGDTRAYTPFGQVATVSKGDPEQKRLYTATREATEASRNAQAAKDASGALVDAARVGLIGAQTTLTKDRTENPQKFMRPTASTQDKPMSASEFQTAVKLKARELHPEAFRQPTSMELMNADALTKLQSAQAAAMKEATTELQANGAHVRDATGLAAPQADDDDGGNDFMNAGEMSDNDIMSY